MQTVFAVEGDLDAAQVQDLRPQLEKLATSETDVVIDFSKVEFIDSSGVGAIVFLFKRLKGANRALELKGVNGQPLELLTYLRLKELFAR